MRRRRGRGLKEMDVEGRGERGHQREEGETD